MHITNKHVVKEIKPKKILRSVIKKETYMHQLNSKLMACKITWKNWLLPWPREFQHIDSHLSMYGELFIIYLEYDYFIFTIFMCGKWSVLGIKFIQIKQCGYWNQHWMVTGNFTP